MEATLQKELINSNAARARHRARDVYMIRCYHYYRHRRHHHHHHNHRAVCSNILRTICEINLIIYII